MTDDGFQRSIDAFARAHDLEDPVELQAYLEELERESPALRREVESLLEAKISADEGAGSSTSEPSVRAGGLLRTSYPTIPGCQILEELGSGGFGTVYRARRQSAELAPVAVKVLRRDRSTDAILERFRRERQLHARMASRYVAHVYDVGTTGEGEPYLMMELVGESQTILDFAQAQRLTIPERLALFRQVCEGVEHLHLNGIYHRDLKPSNILVSRTDAEACPKIIDFGLAKTDDEQGLTVEGARVGTPRYMSPEQRAGEPLDLRTDVYSLGVLLHELLTGVRPDPVRDSEEGARLPSSRVSGSSSSDELLAERRVHSLKQLAKAIRGDLDMIVLKCLRFDRAERYQSAHELTADLLRHEANEPVLARGRSGVYALARLARRHRVAAFSACAGVLALIAGVAVASVALADERKANAALSDRNEDLRRTLAFESQRLASIDPAAIEPFMRQEVLVQARVGLEALTGAADPGELADFQRVLENTNFTTVALEALKHGVFRDAEAVIDAEFAETPLLRATMLLELSNHLAGVGLLELARGPLATSLEIRSAELGEHHADTLLALDAMGILLRKLGEHAAAVDVLDRAIAGAKPTFGNEAAETLRIRHHRALIDLDRFEGPSALVQLETLHPLFVREFGPEHEATLELLINLANALLMSGEKDEVVARLQEVHAELDARRGSEDVVTLTALQSLGAALVQAGQWEESAEVIQRAYEGFSRALGNEHHATLNAATYLAQVYLNEGRIEEAALVLQRSRDVLEEQRGVNNLDAIRAAANLAHVLRLIPDAERALEIGAAAIERARTVLPPDNPLLGSMIVDFGRTLFTCGDMDGAETAFLEGYDLLEDVLGADNDATKLGAEALMLFYGEMHAQHPDAGYDEKSAAWESTTQGFVQPQTEALQDAVRARRYEGAGESDER